MHLCTARAATFGAMALAMAASIVASCSKSPEPAPPPAPPAAVASAGPTSAPAAAVKSAPPLLAPKSPKPAPKTDVPANGQKADASIVLASKADVIVKDMTAGTTVMLNVGQTLGVAGSTDATSWQVDYTGEQLKLLTPRDKMSKPGQAGWVWRAMSPGTIEIAFTSRPPCPVRPCESNPARYAFTVEVRRVP